ncbi:MULTISPECIES: HipA family kinase [unclassified Labrenzia]|uniref:HipA family kinase n=1 Tax=unclassified Labrenzia TaxID=2648686 RepID=UPI0012688BB9|nr:MULTISPECIES: HipA family kinase [unclassified Labrenzia]
MIREAVLSRFDRSTEVGRTEPLRVGVLVDDEAEHDVVLKVSVGPECSIEGLANEMLGSLLAADLGLPVCEPYFVRIERDFLEAVTEPSLRQRLENSCPVAFGSQHAGVQWRRWLQSDRLSVNQIDQAISVLAFDGFIGNSDRNPRNSNMLVRNEDWRLIDHESAFRFRMKLFPRCEPWSPGNLQMMCNFGEDSEHIFARQLAGRNDLDFAPTRARWEGLSDVRLAQYDAALPDEWEEVRPFLSEALEHIKQIRDQIDRCIGEIERVLS